MKNWCKKHQGFLPTRRDMIARNPKLDHCFDLLRVDGNIMHAQHLAGKPAPDTYLMAAKLLGVEPARAVIVEDAFSGVQARYNENFGLVIGVARKGNADELSCVARIS